MNSTLHLLLLLLTAFLVTAPALVAVRRTRSVRQGSPTSPASGMSPAEESRRLIGDAAYHEMHRRVEILMARHAAHSSDCMYLCSGADTPRGNRKLHTLLPGMALILKDASHDDIYEVDVYSDDIRIGSLLFSEAEKALDLMHTRRLTGVYVSEQRAYGDCTTVGLGIVIFHTAPITVSTPAPVEKEAIDHMLASTYKFIHAGLRPVVVYQN